MHWVSSGWRQASQTPLKASPPDQGAPRLLHPCPLRTSLHQEPVSWILPSWFSSLFCWSTFSENSTRKACRISTSFQTAFVSPNPFENCFSRYRILHSRYFLLSLGRPLSSRTQPPWGGPGFISLQAVRLYLFIFSLNACSTCLSSFMFSDSWGCVWVWTFHYPPQVTLVGLLSLTTYSSYLREDTLQSIWDCFFPLPVLCLFWDCNRQTLDILVWIAICLFSPSLSCFQFFSHFYPIFWKASQFFFYWKFCLKDCIFNF